MKDKREVSFKVALVSTPWSIVNRPSLQLATLKSYVEEQSTHRVACLHPYLHLAKALGFDTYARIARSGWAGEALFAPLLFPEMRPRAKQLFQRSLPKNDPVGHRFDQLVDRVEQSMAQWLATMAPDEYDLLGFSVCFFQLLPSLYLATKIKEKHEQPPIVFGGSSCSGKVGTSLFHGFHQIDYLVLGAGEGALLQLCNYLAEPFQNSLPDTILCRHSCRQPKTASPEPTFNDLPFPNFSDYFHEVQKLFGRQHFIPVLVIEFSRGCWWNRCSFCNLNLQWQNYRFKSGERMLKEVLHLTQTHSCLSFAFADNALPMKEADHFFTMTGATGIDFDFFAETRNIADEHRLQRYHLGGLNKIQVGIEALSNSLLTRMAKGSTVLDNIAAMRMAVSCGLHLEANLITEFPATTQEEIAETLTNLDFVLPFAPLQAATFFLGFNSPIYLNAKNFSIKGLLPHAKNSHLFPARILQELTTIISGYRGDRLQQRRLWKPVTEKLQLWQNFHRQRKDTAISPLQYQDGGTFLIITQEQVDGPKLMHRLKGLSRQIYLFCCTPQRIAAVLSAFPKISGPVLDNFLTEMLDKRLMFRGGERVLSLAVCKH